MRWGWRLIIFFVCIILLSSILSHIAIFLSFKAFKAWLALLVTLGVSFLMLKYVDRRPLSSVGLHFYSSWWKELMLGIAIGCSMLVLTKAILWGLSGLNPFKQPAFTDLVTIPAHFRGAVGEELFVRGYPLQVLISSVGVYPAVLITSAFFGLLHYQVLGWMGTVTAGLTGLLLALVVWRTKALWMAVGIHFGWNFLVYSISVPVQPMHLHFQHLADFVATLVFILLLVLIPMHPHPQMEALWQQYIHPAQPWARLREWWQRRGGAD